MHHVPTFGQSEAEVTRKLSKNAYSFNVSSIPSINKYDGAQLASNSPCEDRYVHGEFPSPWNNSDMWMAWAVFDERSGWQTADLLRKQLVPAVRRFLGRLTAVATNGSVSEDLVQRAIMEAFVSLDDSIIKTAIDVPHGKQPLEVKMRQLAPGFAGSCVLLAIYDSTTSKLHVACTGDSRAVLGPKTVDGRWEAIPLSIDQTGRDEDEIARLRLVVSRAFGDGRWKWPLELQAMFTRKYYGPAVLTPTYNIQTPPYITAQPGVTTTKVDDTKTTFLILAPDGLWDPLDNQQAVDLVGKWLEAQANGTEHHKRVPEYAPFDFGRFWKGVSWMFEEERTTIQDDNVAVHLMRNALGGNHHEMLAGRLALSSPLSRSIRDHITVQVVFFK